MDTLPQRQLYKKKCFTRCLRKEIGPNKDSLSQQDSKQQVTIQEMICIYMLLAYLQILTLYIYSYTTTSL